MFPAPCPGWNHHCGGPEIDRIHVTVAGFSIADLRRGRIEISRRFHMGGHYGHHVHAFSLAVLIGDA